MSGGFSVTIRVGDHGAGPNRGRADVRTAGRHDRTGDVRSTRAERVAQLTGNKRVLGFVPPGSGVALPRSVAWAVQESLGRAHIRPCFGEVTSARSSSQREAKQCGFINRTPRRPSGPAPAAPATLAATCEGNRFHRSMRCPALSQWCQDPGERMVRTLPIRASTLLVLKTQTRRAG